MTRGAGASTFAAGGEQYERFMGRYSGPLAARFCDFAGVASGDTAVDIGCGTGALTVELVKRLGADQVAGCDPSPMLDYCRERCPGVELAPGAGEQIPFAGDRFDVALAQLVLHFLTDPPKGIAEMSRTVRPGGRVAAAVWDAPGRRRWQPTCTSRSRGRSTAAWRASAALGWWPAWPRRRPCMAWAIPPSG